MAKKPAPKVTPKPAANVVQAARNHPVTVKVVNATKSTQGAAKGVATSRKVVPPSVRGILAMAVGVGLLGLFITHSGGVGTVFGWVVDTFGGVTQIVG